MVIVELGDVNVHLFQTIVERARFKVLVVRVQSELSRKIPSPIQLISPFGLPTSNVPKMLLSFVAVSTHCPWLTASRFAAFSSEHAM